MIGRQLRGRLDAHAACIERLVDPVHRAQVSVCLKLRRETLRERRRAQLTVASLRWKKSRAAGRKATKLARRKARA